MMTTASLGTRLEGVQRHGSIGNYQRNYQVVMSNSRRINDPFFNDQSFDFALFPETLATRGRFPLTIPVGGVGSALFNGDDGLLLMDTDAGETWEALIGGSSTSAKAYSYSMWIKPNAVDDTYARLISFGDNDRTIYLDGASLPATLRSQNGVSNNRAESSTSLSAGNLVSYNCNLCRRILGRL